MTQIRKDFDGVYRSPSSKMLQDTLQARDEEIADLKAALECSEANERWYHRNYDAIGKRNQELQTQRDQARAVCTTLAIALAASLVALAVALSQLFGG